MKNQNVDTIRKLDMWRRIATFKMSIMQILLKSVSVKMSNVTKKNIFYTPFNYTLK